MEYTKDIILDLRCKRKVNLNRFQEWISSIRKVVKNNKLIITTLLLLSTLMVIDFILINSFLQLFINLY